MKRNVILVFLLQNHSAYMAKVDQISESNSFDLQARLSLSMCHPSSLMPSATPTRQA